MTLGILPALAMLGCKSDDQRLADLAQECDAYPIDLQVLRDNVSWVLDAALAAGFDQLYVVTGAVGPRLAERTRIMVALGRSLLADPYYPKKAQEGNIDQIRPCVGCCLGCIHAVLAKEPGSCVVNPDVGREYKLAEDAPPREKLKVLVAGAGPEDARRLLGAMLGRAKMPEALRVAHLIGAALVRGQSRGRV